MTKEQFKLKIALNPPEYGAEVEAPPASVSQKSSRSNNTLPQELRGPVYQLVKMVGTRKDFWSNVMKEIDSVYQTSEMLSQQKEQLTAVKEQLIAKFSDLVKAVTLIDKSTCEEAIANVHYILKHAPARDSFEANTLVVGNMADNSEDEDMSLSVDITDDDGNAEKEDNFEVENINGNPSIFEDSSDGDSNVIETSNGDSDSYDDENGTSVADKLVQQSSRALSSKNRVVKVNSATHIEKDTLSVMEEVKRRRLRIPRGTDIALCDSKVNSARIEPDVLTIQDESNMTMIPIRRKSSLENTASYRGFPWTKVKPSTDVSTRKTVSLQQESQNIELLDLTGEVVKVTSIKKNVQIETIELEDDDIPLMEASELKIVEELEKGATVVSDDCMEYSTNNIKISQISSKKNDQTDTLVANTTNLEVDLVGNSNKTTSEPLRCATLTRQKIVPVSPGKTMSVRNLGKTQCFQYKQFCELSSLTSESGSGSGSELSENNLHVQKITPFPPYQFVEVPAKPSSPLSTHTPTSASLLPAGNKSSLLAKSLNVQQVPPLKLQSVLQPSLQTPVSIASNATHPKKQIIPNVSVGNVHNQVTLVSSQPGVPNKTVSLMMKNGKVQVLQLPQLSSSSMKPIQMMLSKDSNLKLVPVMKSVLQSNANLKSSSTAVSPPAQLENKQTVSTHKVMHDIVQTQLSKGNESFRLKINKKSFMSQVCKPTNISSSSSEPAAKKLCVRSMNNIGPSQQQSSSPILVDEIRLASPPNKMSATSIIQKEVPESSPSTIPPLQLVNTRAKPTQVLTSTTLKKLSVQQSVKCNEQGKYFIQNQFQLPLNKPLKMSGLKLLGSTLASTSSSPQTLSIKPNVHSDSQQPLHIPLQHAGSRVFKNNTTISHMFPLTDVGRPSTNEEKDEN